MTTDSLRSSISSRIDPPPARPSTANTAPQHEWSVKLDTKRRSQESASSFLDAKTDWHFVRLARSVTWLNFHRLWNISGTWTMNRYFYAILLSSTISAPPPPHAASFHCLIDRAYSICLFSLEYPDKSRRTYLPYSVPCFNGKGLGLRRRFLAQFIYSAPSSSSRRDVCIKYLSQRRPQICS